MNIMTILKCGGEYNEGHLAWLVKQIPAGHTVYCITDSMLDQKRFFETTGAQKIELRYNAWGGRGWWAKMELFRPEIDMDFLYIDLDTVILKSPKDIFGFKHGDPPCVLADFYFPTSSIGSGLMWLPKWSRDIVWEGWMKNPQEHMKKHHGDQDFLTPYFWPSDRFQTKFPFSVVSYKAHISPDDGRQFFKQGFDDLSKIGIVCFHGHPRPWMVDKKSRPWIPEIERLRA